MVKYKNDSKVRLMFVLSLLLTTVVSSFSADIRDFRKRQVKLKEAHEKCLSKSDPSDKASCLEKYEKKKAEYNKDLAKFKQDMVMENQKRKEERGKSSGNIQDDIAKRNESIREFSDFVSSSCQNTTSVRCGSALYQLGNLTYSNEEDGFRVLQAQYEKAMQKWEDRDKQGPEPTAPRRNHTASLDYFERLLKEYPKYPEMPLVYFRLAFISSIQGEDDRSYNYLKQLVTKYPDHALTIPAQLRIGEHFLLLRKYKQAIEAYEKVPSSYRGPEAGLALYHKAESYYNMADFETAAKYYYEYVVKAEKGQLKGDLAAEAKEFMAACWADIDDGVKTAQKFLKGKGHSWEKDVFFQMGEKNKSHDRLDEARKAYEHLLKVDPNYPKAPIADMSIVSMLMIQKREDEAQKARIALVNRYKPGSSWYSANGKNKEGIKEAQEAVKTAQYQIPLFHHLKATKDKDDLDTKELAKAVDGYKQYLQSYNDDSWQVFEVHQNLGQVYHLLKDFTKAAEEYKWCANAPVEKYGKKPSEKSSSLLTKADAAYNRVYMLDLARTQALESVDSNAQKAYDLPQTKSYFAAVEEYMKDFGESNTAPDIAYNASVVHYSAKQYSKAIVALEALAERFPNHKHSNLIRRMLGQSLLEDGQYDKSEEVFTELLNKTPKGDKGYESIQLSVASAIFKQADQKAKSNDNKAAADHYLRMVNAFPNVDIADKALFEAGLQYEKDGDVENATRTLLSLHTRYPKSSLGIKSILRAATVYRNKEQFREAAQTFLVVRDKFPKDSLAFQSIGWAAEAYEKVPDLAMAAKTYESSYQHFPKDVKTPSFIYNAGQTYEDLKDYGNAIRVYAILGEKYPESNYAIEAVFSVPLIQEKQGNYAKAVESYKEFITKYKNDPQKLIRAQLAAGKLYDDKLNKEAEALDMYKQVKNTFEANTDKDIPVAIPAEAAFRSGEMAYDKIAATRLDGNSNQNSARLKEMTKNLEVAIGHFTYAIEKSEQDWTLRSTLKMGDIFMVFADVTGNEKITTNDAMARIAEQIQMKKGLPNFYDKARALYQKNLDLAKEQRIKSPWVDTSAIRYMETYALKGKVFEEIGMILSQSPMPAGEYTPEEIEDYKVALKDKQFEFQMAAKPIYATALKAAQFYGLENIHKDQITERLRAIDPDSPELNLEAFAQDEMAEAFVDEQYKGNLDKISKIYEDPSMSESKKMSALRKLENAAKQEIQKLTQELQNLERTAQQ